MSDDLVGYGSNEPLDPTGDGAYVRRSAVNYRVGGYNYPLRLSQKCSVCTSDARIDIEKALLVGMPSRRIERELANRGVKVSHDSIRSHLVNGHMPLDQTVRRVALEERLKELGKAEEEIEDTLVDHIGFLREVQRRTFERIASGEIEPEVGDGINAAKALAAINAAAGGTAALDAEIMRDAISQMMTAARGVMDDEDWGRYTRSLQQNPVLRSIDAQLRRQAIASESET